MAKGKRVRVVGHLEYQNWTDKVSGETRSRTLIVASQILFLDYDRAHTGLPEARAVEELEVADVAQPLVEQSKPKRSRRSKAA
jgi:single-stranded DNA-binding protein